MSLNRATIIGNVTRDPETRTTPNGQNVANFGVATNHTWTDASGQKQDKAEFHNVVAWGKLAEICSQYLTKGRKVFIEGRLQTREWEGQDAQKRRTTEIVADNMIILDRAGASGAKPFAPSASSAPSFSSPPKNDPAPNPDDEIKVEDIPF